MTQFVLPPASVPKYPSADIDRLLTLIEAPFNPEIVPFKADRIPTPDQLYQCYLVVRGKVEKDGGRMRLGWNIIQSDIVLLAQHHAVWSPPNDPETLICVTPKDRGLTGKILFSLDERYPYLDKDIPNGRVSVPKNKLVEDYILVLRAREILEAQGKYVGRIELKLPASIAPKQLVFANMSKLYLDFISAGSKLHYECFCNSGNKYKECHGLDIRDRINGILGDVNLSLDWMPPEVEDIGQEESAQKGKKE